MGRCWLLRTHYKSLGICSCPTDHPTLEPFAHVRWVMRPRLLGFAKGLLLPCIIRRSFLAEANMYNRSHIFICPADKTAVQQESWIGHIGRQMVRPAVPRQTLASQLSLWILDRQYAVHAGLHYCFCYCLPLDPQACCYRPIEVETRRCLRFCISLVLEPSEALSVHIIMWALTGASIVANSGAETRNGNGVASHNLWSPALSPKPQVSARPSTDSGA